MQTSCLTVQTLLSHRPDSARLLLLSPSSADSYFINDIANFWSVDAGVQCVSQHFVKYVDSIKTHSRAEKEVWQESGKQTSSDKFVAHLVQTV